MMRYIWSNFYLNEIDFEEALENIDDPSERQRICEEINNEYLDDEKSNLDVTLDESIIAICSAGCWDGVHKYVYCLGNNLSDIFGIDDDCELKEWYTDTYNLRYRGAHHDGNNYMLFRKWKPGISTKNKERVVVALSHSRDEALHKKLLSRYTRSLRPDVATVYGY